MILPLRINTLPLPNATHLLQQQHVSAIPTPAPFPSSRYSLLKRADQVPPSEPWSIRGWSGALLNDDQSLLTSEDVRGALDQVRCPEKDKEPIENQSLIVSPCIVVSSSNICTLQECDNKQPAKILSSILVSFLSQGHYLFSWIRSLWTTDTSAFLCYGCSTVFRGNFSSCGSSNNIRAIINFSCESKRNPLSEEQQCNYYRDFICSYELQTRSLCHFTKTSAVKLLYDHRNTMNYASNLILSHKETHCFNRFQPPSRHKRWERWHLTDFQFFGIGKILR